MVGCSGCRYNEEPPLLVELVQQCSDRPDPNVNVHGCSIQNKKPLDMTQRMGLTASSSEPSTRSANPTSELAHVHSDKSLEVSLSNRSFHAFIPSIICFFLSVSDIQQRYVKYRIFLINEKRNIFFSAELCTWNATQITDLKKKLKMVLRSAVSRICKTNTCNV